MKQEVDEVLGNKREITWQDLNRLEYVHWVFKETLRLIPVAPASVREIKRDTVVDGISLPAGSPIIVSKQYSTSVVTLPKRDFIIHLFE